MIGGQWRPRPTILARRVWNTVRVWQDDRFMSMSWRHGHLLAYCFTLIAVKLWQDEESFDWFHFECMNTNRCYPCWLPRILKWAFRRLYDLYTTGPVCVHVLVVMGHLLALFCYWARNLQQRLHRRNPSVILGCQTGFDRMTSLCRCPGGMVIYWHHSLLRQLLKNLTRWVRTYCDWVLFSAWGHECQ
jgi:hypothetical protein